MTLRYHFSPFRLAKIKMFANTPRLVFVYENGTYKLLMFNRYGGQFGNIYQNKVYVSFDPQFYF